MEACPLSYSPIINDYRLFQGTILQHTLYFIKCYLQIVEIKVIYRGENEYIFTGSLKAVN